MPPRDRRFKPKPGERDWRFQPGEVVEEPFVLPEGRRVLVTAENRMILVAQENRMLSVVAENRMILV